MVSPLTQSLIAHPLYDQAATPRAQQQGGNGLADALDAWGSPAGSANPLALAGGPEANLSGFAAGAGPLGPSGGALSPGFADVGSLISGLGLGGDAAAAGAGLGAAGAGAAAGGAGGMDLATMLAMGLIAL